MHSWYGTEWNFPSIEKRDECFRTRILCCQCFFFNTDTTCIPVCPLPGRKRRDPEPWPFDGQAWWKESAAIAWEIGSGKPSGCLAPNHRCVRGWLLSWWGSGDPQAPFSFLFWGFVAELSPLRSFPREGTKMQHTHAMRVVFHWARNKMEVSLWITRRARGKEGKGSVWRRRECCIFLRTSWVLAFGFLAHKERLLPSWVRLCGHTGLPFSLGPAMGIRAGHSPPSSKFSGNTVDIFL